MLDTCKKCSVIAACTFAALNLAMLAAMNGAVFWAYYLNRRGC